MGYSKQQSNSMVSIFIAFNFLLHLFAGYIGGRFLDNKNLLGISLISQNIGCLFLQNNYLYIGLSFFLIGTGFGVTCLNCLLTDQFDSNNHEKREKAFFLNYAALNLGFFLGLFISGYFYSLHNYHSLFRINSFSSLIALVFFLFSKKYIVVSPQRTKLLSINPLQSMIGLITVAFLFVLVLFGLYFKALAGNSVLIASFLSVGYILFQAKRSTIRVERNKLYTFLIFMSAAILFWTLYFIGPMGFMFFLKHNVQHSFLGLQLSPQWFMNLDSILVIIGSPILASCFQRLNKRKIYVSIVKKFSCALLAIAIAYFLLSLGINNANSSGIVGIGWVFSYYLLQSLGELLIAPVGYAMIGQLAPQRLQGVMMGTWMMVCGVATIFSYHTSNAMTLLSTDNQ